MQKSGNRPRLRGSARTNIGQVRANNEDSVRLWAHGDAILAVVADGMGGAAAGEEASRIAVEAVESTNDIPKTPILEVFDQLDDETVANRMRTMIHTANRNIMHYALSNPQSHGMGTTVTLAFVRDLNAIIAHVGDSRAYLVQKNTPHYAQAIHPQNITQITADHSFVEVLVAAGHITHEQAEDHPMRNVLYRALGQTEELDVDMYHVRLRAGDWIILCSDGLTRHVKPDEIAQATTEYDNPDDITQALIDLANERGGEDNVSVIAIVVDALDDDATLDPEDTLILRPANLPKYDAEGDDERNPR